MDTISNNAPAYLFFFTANIANNIDLTISRNRQRLCNTSSAFAKHPALTAILTLKFFK